MRALVDALARELALADGHAVTVAEATVTCPDPEHVFGVATVKIVSEDVVQALAFGDLGEAPQVLSRWNPMSRESGDLEPFATALGSYLLACETGGVTPRIWLPHGGTLDVLDLLGRRYRTNPNASPELQRMGVQLRAITEEATVPGQQIVVVASEILQAHATTGQAPIRDMHLGALLTWFESIPGANGDEVTALAEAAAAVPATGILDADEDDRCEALRRQAKAAGGAGPARDAIDAILAAAAEREWDRLLRARRAWQRLALPAAPQCTQLSSESRDRLAWAISAGAPTRSRPAALMSLLGEHERAIGIVEDARRRHDGAEQRRARLSGHVWEAEVLTVRQPRRNFKPCEIDLHVPQPVVRLRTGAKVTPLDGSRIGATVTAVGEHPDGGWIVRVTITSGVRTPPVIGSSTIWVEAPPPDLKFLQRQAQRRMADADHPILTGSPLPAPAARAVPTDLLGRARALRRGSA